MNTEDRFMTLREVRRLTALGKTTVYKLLKQGTFPRPLQVGERAVRWRASEVRAWMDARTPTDPTPANLPDNKECMSTPA